jgi:hypothetical protein
MSNVWDMNAKKRKTMTLIMLEGLASHQGKDVLEIYAAMKV